MKQAQDFQIQRQLDRLKSFSCHQDPKLSISAFFHIAQSLSKYAENHKQNDINDEYFKQFYAQYQKFAKQDFSGLKSNYQSILDEIVQIVESKNFITHLRSDKKKLSKIRNSLNIRKSQVIELVPQIYKFDGAIQKQPEKDEQQIQSNLESQKSQTSISTQQNQSHEQEQLFAQIKRLYDEHIIDQAYQKVNEYLEMIPDLKTISKQRVKLIETINMERETVRNLHQEFIKPGWVLDYQQDGIQLYYKIYQNQGAMAVKLQGQGQFPIAPFLAIISEIDLIEKYVPFCYDSKQIKNINRNQKIGTSKIYLPVLSDREQYFYAAGYDRIKLNKSLFFFTKSISGDEVYQKKYDFKVPQTGEFVRLQYEFFIIEYQPLQNNRARIKLASKVDMKINFVPEFIMFKCSKMFAMDYFKNILQNIKNFKGSPWQKKVQENPYKYKFFDKKIKEYLLK